MKPQKIRNQIHDMVSQIENIVTPLRQAAAKLKLAEARLDKDESGVSSLAAIKEAHLLIHQALTASEP